MLQLTAILAWHPSYSPYLLLQTSLNTVFGAKVANGRISNIKIAGYQPTLLPTWCQQIATLIVYYLVWSGGLARR